MTMVTLPQLGGCLCGAVRYELTAPPLLAYACHCTDCQTRSGSVFALTAVVNTRDLALIGTLETVGLTTPSGRSIDHSFCPECRVRLLARAPAAADYTSLRVGTLDDARWIVPVVQFYTGSALPWAVIPNVRLAGPDGFDFPALAREWKATKAPQFNTASPDLES